MTRAPSYEKKLIAVKAPTERSQHFDATDHNIVGPVVSSRGQTIATFRRNRSQHCWPSSIKPRPNDRNISTQAAAKRSQHFDATDHNIVGPVVSSRGQTIATFRRNRSQHCWLSSIKPRPNDRNISTQHIATLLGATCCVRLASPVATCCDMLGVGN